MNLLDILKYDQTREKGITFYSDDSSKEFISYHDVYQKSLVLLKKMQDYGITSGMTVILQVRDKLSFTISLWACIMGGYIITPLDLVDDNPDNLAKFKNVSRMYPEAFILYDQASELFRESGADNSRIISCHHLMAGAGQETNEPELHIPSEDEILFLLFSSGSTGTPKGIKLSHRNILTSVRITAEDVRLTEQDVIANWMPLTHVMGLIIFHLMPVYGRCSQVQMSKELFVKFPASYLHILDREAATIVGFPNFAFSLLCDNVSDDEIERLDLSDIRYVYNGAEPIIVKKALDFQERYKQYGLKEHLIHAGYGMTEAVAAICVQPFENKIRTLSLNTSQFYQGIVTPSEDDKHGVHLISVGCALPGLSIKIYDDENRELPEDTIGNIVVKGDVVSQEQQMADGYYLTGDLGFIHDREVFVTGRKRDLVFFNGQNFYSQDIERICEELPEIESGQTVVCGNTNFETGKEEMIVFFASSEVPEPIQEKILQLLRREIHQNATFVIPVERIPTTPSGKKQRYKLLNEYQTGKYIEFTRRQGGTLNPQDTPRAAADAQLEQEIIKIFTDILGVSGIGNSDNFHSLGGDSIKMLGILGRIEKKLHKTLPPGKFMELGTPSAISAYLAEADKESRSDSYPEISANDREAYMPFPLTDVQAAYFAGRNNDFELGGISTHFYYELGTDLDLAQLSESFQILIAQHPMLRAIISEDGQQQILETIPKYEIPVSDMVGAADDEISATEHNIRNELSHQIFDIHSWPLFDIRALKTSDENCLFLSFDMMIVDGASFMMLVKQWLEIYFTGTPTTADSAAKVTYRDYVLALDNIKKSELYHRDKEYWLKKLPLFPKAPELPLKTSAGNVKHPHFCRRQKRIKKAAWNALKKYAGEKGITASILLFTAYCDILSLYSNQTEFAVNTTVFNRYPVHRDIDKLVGDFTSILLIGVNYEQKGSFPERAARIRQELLEALEHRHYDGMEFVRDIQKHNQTQGCAVMPVVFTSMIFEDEQYGALTDLGVVKDGISQTSQVMLDFQLSIQQGELMITWDYEDNLLDHKLIAGMQDQFVEQLFALLKGDELSSVTVDQQTVAAVAEYNNTQAEWDKKSFPELFRQTVGQYPQNIAAADGQQAITYTELDQKSNQVAAYLLENGAQTGSLYGIMAERNTETIINVVGILKAGVGYVALEPDYPESRKEYILQDANAVGVLDTHLLNTEILTQYPEHEISRCVTPEMTMYVIYTSGSTGKPKGVVISHEAALNTIIGMNERFHISETDNIIGLSSMCFDLSVYDIFGALLSGASLYQIPELHNIDHIFETITEKGITIWNSVPVVMEMLLDNLSREQIMAVQQNDPGLRLALLSGDWIPLALPEKMLGVFNKAELISLGGATEGAIWSVYYPVEHVNPQWLSIPYGYPLSNQTMYVLGQEQELTPVGVTGELYIGGAGVARGYINDEDKTRAAFIHHPKWGKLYKTGDYGYFSEDGYIVFQGRKDDQIKINGHRVELGEIDNCLRAVPGITNAAVIDREDKNGNKQICAYVVSEEAVSAENIKTTLSQQLPDYMIPGYITPLAALPLTANGKINKKALPLPDLKVMNEESGKAAGSDTEKQLMHIWREILQASEIGADETFFKLGGDSMSMVRVITKVKEEFEVKISFREFLAANNVIRLSKLIDEKMSAVAGADS